MNTVGHLIAAAAIVTGFVALFRAYTRTSSKDPR
jgi:hypothetical protein